MVSLNEFIHIQRPSTPTSAFQFKVARGNCFLELRSPSWHVRTFCVVRGISKFTGGMGDDDDRILGDDSTWKSYFTKV